MKLNALSDKNGARRARKRVGRGIGSGTGKTSGRGVKGQKSRSGVSLLGFEGGQMPLYRRLPHRGFINIFRASYVELGLARLQKAIDSGQIDASKPITEKGLAESGVIRRVRDGVRLLGKDGLTTAVTIEVSGASKGATAAVENVGGTLNIRLPTTTSGPKAKGQGAAGQVAGGSDETASAGAAEQTD